MFEAWLPLKTPLERLMWLRRVISGGASWVWRTTTGAAPLSLANATSRAIRYLTQYGLCTQSTTPTPDAPVDIVCNNGALRYGAVGKNLYNVATDVNGYAIDASGNVTAASTACYSALIPVTEGEYAYSGVCSTQGGSNNKRVHGYANGVWMQQLAMYVVPAGSDFSYVFTVPSGIDAIRISHWSEDAQTQVERGSNASDYEPFVGGIVADGTPEVLTVSGKNEANVADYSQSFTNRYYVDKAIGVTLEVGVTYTFSCDIECSITPFGISVGVGNDVVYLVDIVTKPNQTNGRVFVTFTPSATALSNYSKLYIRIPRFTEAKTGTVSVSKIQLERSSSATDYEPYVTPQTVTDIPMLLSVNDYKDEAEIISGLLTHKVGVKVLDGTESWALSDSGSTHRFRGTKPSDCHTPASRAPSVCTHFKYVSTGSAVGGMFIGASQYWYFIPTDQTIDTVDKWTAWVAGQYAAGTPVIVVYPLAEETTEQTAPHTLRTSEGTNTVSVVCNVDPVDLSVEYASTQEGEGNE